MEAKRIDGKALAAEVKAKAATDVHALQELGVQPKLVVFLVGNDAASAVYVRGKAKDCGECGIDSEVVRLAVDTTEAELLQRIEAANNDAGIHGILVQLPLPGQINERSVIEAISPAKDVDGFHPINVGRLHIGEDCLEPCTPAGSMYMLRHALGQQTGTAPSAVSLAGMHAVVVGRSNIVGKPMAAMLVAANATVTVCHTKTADMAAECRRADVLIAAAGRAGLITADMVKPGAIVIDVGMNRGADGKLCGDVDFDAVKEVAGALTPVPGGVGLMTRAMLMHNTVKAAAKASGIGLQG